MSSHPVQVFVAIFILEKDQLLLVTHVKQAEQFHTFVGGKVEPGELCSRAAIREADEEAGIHIAEQDLVFAHSLSRKIDENTSSVILFFYAKKWEGIPYNKEPLKHQSVTWYPTNALPPDLRPHQRQAFQLWQKGCMYSEFQSDITDQNREFYDKNGAHFETLPFAKILPPLIEKYMQQAGSTVLDIGAGTGVLGVWLKQKGFSVLCLDPSSEMIKRCTEKGLDTFLGTIQNFDTTKQFDSIFAISSLIHLRKEEFPEQIRRISSLLNPQGLFFLTIIKGDSQGWEDPTKAGMQRFFSSFTQEDADAILLPHFSILEQQEKEVSSMHKTFLIYVLKKR